MNIRTFVVSGICFFLCMLAIAAQAQIPSHSGAAFFITPGYVITNEHIVHDGCTQIILQDYGSDWNTAQIVAVDEAHDLALMRTSNWPYDVALLRKDINGLAIGNDVVTLGYPLESQGTNTYEIGTAKIINPNDSLGNTHMLQFSDATKEGYSGGPLLDASGKVVGVVKGIIKKYQVDTLNGQAQNKQLTDTVDEAVNLSTLEAFLATNNISFLSADYSDGLNKHVHFIVNVQCLLK